MFSDLGLIGEVMPMLLSLLIPTIKSRHQLFVRLCDSLQQQIQSSRWSSEVEVLSELDNGELSIGWKRNLLMSRASGQWIAFIDDDDLVSPDYVDLICSAIVRRPEIDCVGIKGIITFRGSHPRDVFCSLRYPDVFSRNHTYYRPPYHLNPIRREIAQRYEFLNVNYSEDFEWAEQMRRDKALKNEEIIDSVIYYYRSRRLWAYQLILDVTEGLRHRLGIRLTNRFAVKKALSSALGSRQTE